MLVNMKKEKAIENQLGFWLYVRTTIPISFGSLINYPMFFCAIFFESEVVGFHCSPYSATVLLSKPHQGKLTIEADLIFEDYSTASAIICLNFFCVFLYWHWISD